MSRFLVVQLFAAAVRAGRWLPLVLLYVEAMEYPPSQQEVEKMLAEPTDLDVMMFLSTGVFGLTVVPELSSVAMRGQPIRVVAFPSWNPTQMAAICSEIQASYFTIVHGIPPDAANGWRPEALRRFNRIESLPDCHEIDVGTLDYRDTLTALLRLYSAHAQRERFVVVPTGSKMQAVAVGLLCGWLYDIQIAYPTPRTFSAPHDYTKGVRRAYRVDLGSPGATNVRPHQSRPVRG